MNKREDFLVEIYTEELPAKILLSLAQAFGQQMRDRVEKAQLAFDDLHFFVTPCRLAIFIKNLAAAQTDQIMQRKGPLLSAAFDSEGHPSKACAGFARANGVTPDALITIKTEQGEWVGIQQTVHGKSVAELLPDIIQQAVNALPIPKCMRWGDGHAQFVRPVHALIMLYGDEIIPATLFGCDSGRVTRGHRFHAPDWITIPHAANYAAFLAAAYVEVDFTLRCEKTRQQAIECVEKKWGKHAHVLLSPDLLNEVTNLVEWPVALSGCFDAAFLALPAEVLISSMQDHQRYFPIADQNGKLLPHFVTISNIQSHDPERVIHGNERVLRARLSDAAFFYAADKKENWEQRIDRLKGIVFQTKLGTLYDKAARTSKLAVWIAEKIGAHIDDAARASWLAKADLTTQMVGEFPELQGIMGCDYAQQTGEREDVAIALKEHYLPRFAGDVLPKNPIGQVLAIADRVDTLVGMFGIHSLPTGDKDPYGLRRAAVSVLRILIENKINLDLKDIFSFAISCYQDGIENPETIKQVLYFLQERLRFWYQEQGISADVFAAVAALNITNPRDGDERMKAVQAFKKLKEAQALSIANKRVSHILEKEITVNGAKTIDPAYFENAAERELAHQLAIKSKVIAELSQTGQYEKILLQLAELHQPIDDFFDQVMVMTEDQPRRNNRLLLLSQLRTLFLQVADIALLQ